MLKILPFFFFFCVFVEAINICGIFPRLKQCKKASAVVPSSVGLKDCSHHGHVEQQGINPVCICRSQFSGQFCELANPRLNESWYSSFNESHFYDWREIKTRNRIDFLYNLDPDSPQSDLIFPPNSGSINVSQLPDEWISLKTLNSSKGLFNGEPKITDILQGGFQSCFFYAALASVLNLPNGAEVIKNAIPYYNESNGVYATKWLLFGRYVYVSVDDQVPGNPATQMPYFAQIPSRGSFWVAILEKAWAKIWGNYEAILFTTEAVIWNALTGAVLKKTINVYDLNLTLPVFLQSRLGSPTPGALLTAKTPTAAKHIIPDHSFSILKMFKLKLPHHIFSEYFFYMYNPWGVDLEPNPWNDSNPIFKLESVKSQLIGIPFEEKNDGKFFYNYKNLLETFERIIIVETNSEYDVSSLEIPLGKELNSKITIEFLGDHFEQTFLYFDLLNDNIFNEQIQPYGLSNLFVSPLGLGYGSDINNQYQMDLFTTENSFIYQGIVSLFPSLLPTLKVSFTVSRYNHDIVDRIYLSFYANKNKIKVLEVTQFSNSSCSEDCSANGKCEQNVCKCDAHHFGVACTINENKLTPNPDCSKCNQNNSYCLSTGQCKCFPGFDNSRSCAPCQDNLPFLCKLPQVLCLVKIVGQSYCPKTCMTGDCYIPGRQVQCQATGCNNRGRCNTNTGFCESCLRGYSGPFCEIAPST